jgi:hypothetical protein
MVVSCERQRSFNRSANCQSRQWFSPSLDRARWLGCQSNWDRARRNIGLPLFGVVGGQRPVNNLRTGAGHVNHLLGQLLDAELVGIAQIERSE